MSEPIFSKSCLRGRAFRGHALEGESNENGGFGKTSSGSVHRRVARRVVSTLLIAEKISFGIRPRGCGVLSCVSYGKQAPTLGKAPDGSFDRMRVSIFDGRQH